MSNTVMGPELSAQKMFRDYPSGTRRGIRDVATHLAHPGGIGLRRDARDLDAAGRQLHEKEHGKSRQAATGPDIDGEEVGGGEDVRVGFQELCPRGLLRPVGRRFQAVSTDDVGDGATADFMIETGQGPFDPPCTSQAVRRFGSFVRSWWVGGRFRGLAITDRASPERRQSNQDDGLSTNTRGCAPRP